MSSLLLKASLRKLALRSRSHSLRMFSSSTSTTNPYFLHRCVLRNEESQMTEFPIFDPAKEEYFTVEKQFPKELVEANMVGSSHGWGVLLSPPASILISDYPSSSKSNPKHIRLTSRPYLNNIQTESVSGVAMSSSPEEEDCVIAIKYTGGPVGIYPPCPATSTLLRHMPPRTIDYFEQSKLMYSKRDQRFYMPSSGGHHLFSWDATLPSTPYECQTLRFHNLPQFSHSDLQLLDSCYRAHQLVESPSGQRFLVKWYVQSPAIKSLSFNCGGTKRFMVFREEEDMNMYYTEDIGDLCIFLGNNEPFCVNASSFPGLNPNSIYFLGYGYGEGFGVYDIATRTPRSFKPKSPSGFSTTIVLPFWIPPK